MENTDVIVAGAGIIGLSVALELARQGVKVCVLEKGPAMSEASWAAAGMLAAHDLPGELGELSKLSLTLYPEYLRIVEELSGRPVPMRTHYALVSDGDNHGGMSTKEAHEQVPGIEMEGKSFFGLQEASFDPRDLCAALPLAATAAGATLQEQTEVLAIRSQQNSVEVTTRNGRVSGGAFVNCCGAWAGQVQQLGVKCQPSAAVEPWKGQIFMVRLAPPLDLHCVLRTPEVYLVPRGGGYIVIGATVERAGFDRRVEPSTVERLHALASKLWPPIASAPVVESWTGLRPGTIDGLPLIGSSGQPHCWVATAHFRNGILLAPATGLIMRQLLQGKPPAAGLANFAPGRFPLSDKVQSAGL